MDRIWGAGGRLRSGGSSKNAYNRSTLARTWVHRFGNPSRIFCSIKSFEMSSSGSGYHLSTSPRQNLISASLVRFYTHDDQPKLMRVRRILVAYRSAQNSVTKEPVQDNGHLEAEMDPIGEFFVPQTHS